ncbi:MAG: PAM68 family protein [Cyanobacteriota bacterium]|nr:PAM68 family protein [Cyanobacteriota bacterium]
MGNQRRGLPFEPDRGKTRSTPSAGNAKATQAIPKSVANRMARRVAVFTGLPTLAGMGVFVGSYVLITRDIADIAPGTTLAASGFCFLLGLGGLSYGVLSASWEANDGSLLGLENIRTNLDRMRSSIRAQKQNRSN